MYMFVYLFLSFANRFVPAAAYETPVRRVEREISDRQPFGLLPSEQYLGLQYGAPLSKWNSPATYPADAINFVGRNEFEQRGSPPDLEISKSIELKFDPKNQMLTPVNEVSGEEAQLAEKSSLALLTPFIQKRLNKILDKYDKEAKGTGITDVKNYQTGRFKLYYLKRPRFRV